MVMHCTRNGQPKNILAAQLIQAVPPGNAPDVRIFALSINDQARFVEISNEFR